PGRHVYGTDPALADSMVGLDPPEHTRLRKLVAGAFTQKRIQALRLQVAKIVDDLIDRMLAGSRPADLVHSFSVMVPASGTCMLLGVPISDVNRFHALSNEIFGDWNRSPDEIAKAYTAMAAYIAKLIVQKRMAPEDDLISVLNDARDSTEKLSEVELIKFCVGL